MIIAIVGGGNSAHILLNLYTRQNIECILITRRPTEWNTNGITMQYGTGSKRDIYTGRKFIVSSDYKLTHSADVIFLCCPINVQISLLQKLKPFIKRTALIGTVFGQSRFDKMVEYVMGPKQIPFSFIQIPWICRASKYGQTVDNTGDQSADLAFRETDSHLLKTLDLSWMEHIYTDKRKSVHICSFAKEWFFPSNNVMHPGICYGRHLTKSKSLYFYHNISPISGACIDELDSERLKVVQALNDKYSLDINTESIVQIWNVWKPAQGNTMFECIRNEPRLQPITVPCDIHYNYKHRFFQDDIPYGLCYIKYVASQLSVETPFTDRVICWAQKLMNVRYINEESGQLITENLPQYYVECDYSPVRVVRAETKTLNVIDNLLEKIYH